MVLKAISAIGLLCRQPEVSRCAVRALSSSGPLHAEGGWFNKLLVRKIEPTKESHSSMLADKQIIYELQTHNVRPGLADDYLKNYEHYAGEVAKHSSLSLSLVGSWTVGIGDQDQCVHLWRYDGGYGSVDAARGVLRTDQSLTQLTKEQAPLLRARHCQLLYPFTFWPTADQRTGPNIYEIRSYFLKPGTMMEWGNNWARAITFRQSHNEAYGGFFSQIGRLYNVHHIWCYPSLKERKQSREEAWTHPGWDEVVAYTVPLIRMMDARVMHPTAFSKTQ